MDPVLIVVGGLPGVGKSTIAYELARRRAVGYLRVDRIEQAVVDWTALEHPVGPVGYAVAHALAAEQLGLGLDVVVECVNPVAVTRDAWPVTAREAGAALVEVEIVCSDPVEHRRRIEHRGTDVAGLVKPSWAEVVGRDYERWSRAHLVIDSATTDVDRACAQIVDRWEAVRAGS